MPQLLATAFMPKISDSEKITPSPCLACTWA